MIRNLTKVLFVAIIIIAMSIAGIGCKSSTTEETVAETVAETAAETTAAETTAAETTAAEAEEPLTFGMAVKWAGVPYVQAFMNGANDKAKELGVNIIFKDSDDNPDEALNIIDSFLSQGIDGYIHVSTSNEVAAVPGLIKMNEAGIPIAAMDVPVGGAAGGDVVVYVNPSNTIGGQKAAEAMIQGIKNKYNGEVPEGVIIQVAVSYSILWSQTILEGFDQVISQYPQLEIAQGEGHDSNIDTNEVVSDLLTKHGDKVIGIYTDTAETQAVGAASAVEAAGLDPADFFISGYCMGPEVRDAIKDGRIYAVSHHASYDCGYLAVQYLYDHIKGKEIPKVGDTLVDENAEWSPASVKEYPGNPDFGIFIELGTGVVGLEEGMINPDDPKLWENKMDQWGDL